MQQPCMQHPGRQQQAGISLTCSSQQGSSQAGRQQTGRQQPGRQAAAKQAGSCQAAAKQAGSSQTGNNQACKVGQSPDHFLFKVSNYFKIISDSKELLFDPFLFKLELLLALTITVEGTATMALAGIHKVRRGGDVKLEFAMFIQYCRLYCETFYDCN